MSDRFITILEAVKLTGKSRRTIQRLVQALAQNHPDQVMQEKTARGYIWKISEQCVQQAFGVARSPVSAIQPVANHQPPALAAQPEKYIEVALQGYTGIMAMHNEVKQVYEDRLKEKVERIAELTQELDQARKGLWARLFGG